MSVLQILHSHLNSGGVLTGLAPVFFRWYDEHTAVDAAPTILFKPAGGGTANELGQQPDVVMSVCHSPYRADLAYEACVAIRDYLIENYTIADVANFEILADVTGPFALENERQICELNVRIWI